MLNTHWRLAKVCSDLEAASFTSRVNKSASYCQRLCWKSDFLVSYFNSDFGEGFFLAADQDQVAEINYGTNALTQDKNRVLPMDGVAQQDHASTNTEIPEGQGDGAFTPLLRYDPLDQKPHKKTYLPNEANNYPRGQVDTDRLTQM